MKLTLWCGLMVACELGICQTNPIQDNDVKHLQCSGTRTTYVVGNAPNGRKIPAPENITRRYILKDNNLAKTGWEHIPQLTLTLCVATSDRFEFSNGCSHSRLKAESEWLQSKDIGAALERSSYRKFAGFGLVAINLDRIDLKLNEEISFSKFDTVGHFWMEEDVFVSQCLLVKPVL